MEDFNPEVVTYNDFASRIDNAYAAGLMTEEQASVAKNRAYQFIQQRDVNKATLNAFMNSDEISDKTKLYNVANGDLNSYNLSESVRQVTHIGDYMNELYKTDEQKQNGHIFEVANGGFWKKDFNNAILTALHRQGYKDDDAIRNLGIQKVENGWKVSNNFAALSVFAKAYSDVWNDMGLWRKLTTDSADSFVSKMKQNIVNFSMLPSDQSTFRPNDRTLYSDHSILMAIDKERNDVQNEANKLLKNEGYDAEQDNNLVGLYQTNLGTLEVQLNRANGAYKSDTDYKRDVNITDNNFWSFFTNASTANYKMYAYGGDNISEDVRELKGNERHAILDNLSEVTLDQNKRLINDIIKEELNQVDRENNTSRLHVSFGMSGGIWGHIINVDAAPKTEKYKGHQSFKVFVPYDENGNSPENNIVTKFITRPENMAIQNVADLTSKNNSKIRKGVTFGFNNELSGSYRYLGKNEYDIQLYEFTPSSINGNMTPRIITRNDLTNYLSKCYLYDQSVNNYSYYYNRGDGLLPNGRNSYEAYLDNLNSVDEAGYTFADYVHMFTGKDLNTIKQSFEEDFRLR